MYVSSDLAAKTELGHFNLWNSLYGCTVCKKQLTATTDWSGEVGTLRTSANIDDTDPLEQSMMQCALNRLPYCDMFIAMRMYVYIFTTLAIDVMHIFFVKGVVARLIQSSLQHVSELQAMELLKRIEIPSDFGRKVIVLNGAKGMYAVQ